MKPLLVGVSLALASPVLGAAPAPGSLSAARGLVRRVLGAEANRFVVEPLPPDAGRDAFEIESEGPRIALRGDTGVAIASALNAYLKEYAHCDLGWCGSNLRLPDPLPPVAPKVRRTSPYPYRYYLNYCTFSYSMSWWGWDRWEREIDWMALNGINAPLALTGQNAALRRAYRSLGFTDAELADFFSGPAYFAWFWMGNLDGWGGPLPLDFMDRQEALERRILERERSLGMTPILPAFAGHVPPAFLRRFPQARVKRTNWGSGFGDVVLLDPADPLFGEVGRRILGEEIRAFGTDHLYSADTFNENRPPSSDPKFLTASSREVYESMAAVDPAAVWVMQGWLFIHDRTFWKQAQIKALLDGVPDDRMIVLDLFSEASPAWDRTRAYYGKPWIWCMLQNFGGRVGIFGRMPEVAAVPAAVLRDPARGRYVGIGLTPEAIGQNPAVYELMMENAWRDRPIPLDAWVKGYAIRRYGAEDGHAARAWAVLLRTAYAGALRRGAESILTGRPTLDRNTNFTDTDLGYRPEDLLPAWDELIAAAPHLERSDGFRYDLVDVTRQVLANYADAVQQDFARAYRTGDRPAFERDRRSFLGLFTDLDRLVGTRPEFLLGRWLSDARACGTGTAEKDLFERDARDQLTLWGGPDSPLHDYADKQWSGLLDGFYRPRWDRYLAGLSASLRTGRPFDAAGFERRIRAWEWSWVQGHGPYRTEPRGDSVAVARALYARYRPVVAAPTLP